MLDRFMMDFKDFVDAVREDMSWFERLVPVSSK